MKDIQKVICVSVFKNGSSSTSFVERDNADMAYDNAVDEDDIVYYAQFVNGNFYRQIVRYQ